jgi:hypothetical protein
MAKVYSERLLHGGATASLSAIVPADTLWIVRDAAIFTGGETGSDEFNLAVAGAVIYYAGYTPPTFAYYHWEGRQVCYAGEELLFTATNDAWYVLVSGYALSLP